MRSSASTPTWWPGSVGYEVYVRSFADSDGDGLGDLEGVRSHLDYLQWLGIDVVWLTPFFPSPDFDHGYDVSDYRGVDPRMGDLAGFARLVDEIHRRRMRVIIDVVPNHSSSRHPFFVQARADRTSPYRDWYLWSDPSVDGGPPNNWVSHFGGPAWSLDADSGQYYCHLFHREQPDLNWRNRDVRRYFVETITYWCERGVDGFRVDVAHGLLKDPGLRDNPARPATGTRRSAFEDFVHRFDLDQDDTPVLYGTWAEAAARYDACLLGEVGASGPDRIARYTKGGGLHSAFFLESTGQEWQPAELLARFRAMHTAEPDRMSWVLDNHDQPRSSTRFGGGAGGARRSLALMTLLFGLGGVPFLYQGQELGLEDGAVDPADRQDPIAHHNPTSLGRDGSRTAMPWSPGPGNGFSTGLPWLRAADRTPDETVSSQQADPGAEVHRYRSLIAARKSYPDLWRASATWLDGPSPEFAMLRRGSVLVAVNLADHEQAALLPPGPWQVVYESGAPDLVDTVHNAQLAIPDATGVILVRS